MKTDGQDGSYEQRRMYLFLHLILIFCYYFQVDKRRFQHATNGGPNHPERLVVDIYEDSQD